MAVKPSLAPWRALLAKWPDEWRERWGIRANALEDEGYGWLEAERLAWNETLAAKRAACPATPTVPIEPARSTRSLFKNSA